MAILNNLTLQNPCVDIFFAQEVLLENENFFRIGDVLLPKAIFRARCSERQFSFLRNCELRKGLEKTIVVVVDELIVHIPQAIIEKMSVKSELDFRSA